MQLHVGAPHDHVQVLHLTSLHDWETSKLHATVTLHEAARSFDVVRVCSSVGPWKVSLWLTTKCDALGIAKTIAQHARSSVAVQCCGPLVQVRSASAGPSQQNFCSAQHRSQLRVSNPFTAHTSSMPAASLVRPHTDRKFIPLRTCQLALLPRVRLSLSPTARNHRHQVFLCTLAASKLERNTCGH